jgi:prevent-host-death family protein
MTKIMVNYKKGQTMETLSLSEAKMKLSELIDRVQSTDAEIVITKNGRPAAVLVSPDEFEGWKETISIQSDKELMAEIKKGMSALKKKSKLYTLEELLE